MIKGKSSGLPGDLVEICKGAGSRIHSLLEAAGLEIIL
jgi:hypothetical protein